MTSEKEPTKGAPGSPGEGEKPPDEPTTPAPAAEDKMLVDGRKVVFESDLIAAKESLQKDLDAAKVQATADVTKMTDDLSVANTALTNANAKLQEAEQARATGATSEEEVARLKQEAETAKATAETASTNALTYRRAAIATTYNVKPEELEGKDMVQLEAFEQALKAITSSGGGIGAYAIGGGGGDTEPETPMDRAGKVLESTPIRGTRNAPATEST